MAARDFRAWAREALNRNWGTAILVALVGSFFVMGIDMVTPYLTVNVETMEVGFGEGGLINAIPRETMAMMFTVTLVTLLAAFVLGGAASLGMSTYFTNLVTHREAKFKTLFCHFDRIWDGFRMNFMIGLLVSLWSLVFVIPGIIAAYRYAMIPYLMAEFPDLKVMDAFRESKRLMRGNKFRLFCMHLSFIGWNLLSALTMGLIGLWVAPYVRASEAAFYMEVTGRGQARYNGVQQPRPMVNGSEF